MILDTNPVPNPAREYSVSLTTRVGKRRPIQLRPTHLKTQYSNTNESNNPFTGGSKSLMNALLPSLGSSQVIQDNSDALRSFIEAQHRAGAPPPPYLGPNNANSHPIDGQPGIVSAIASAGELPSVWYDTPPEPEDVKAGEDGYTDDELKAMGDDRLSRVIKDLIRRLRDSKTAEASTGDTTSAETSAWLAEQLRRAERVYGETKASDAPGVGVVGYGPGPRFTTKIVWGTPGCISSTLGVSSGYYDKCCYEDGNPTDVRKDSPYLNPRTVAGKRYNFTEVVHICCYEMGRWCRFSAFHDVAANVYSGAHQSSGLCNQHHAVDKDCLA